MHVARQRAPRLVPRPLNPASPRGLAGSATLDRLVAQEVNVKENVCSPTHDGTGQKYGPGSLKKEVWGWKK